MFSTHLRPPEKEDRQHRESAKPFQARLPQGHDFRTREAFEENRDAMQGDRFSPTPVLWADQQTVTREASKAYSGMITSRSDKRSGNGGWENPSRSAANSNTLSGHAKNRRSS